MLAAFLNRSRLALAVALAVTATLAITGSQEAWSAGAVYHVATSGSDAGPGSAEAPFGTIHHAVHQLRPGDVLFVHGGVYREAINTRRLVPGRPDARIRVEAVPGERPVVSGHINVRHIDHWTFDGINVTHDPEVTPPNAALVRLVDGVGWAYLNAEIWGARSHSGVRIINDEVSGQPAGWRFAGNCVHTTVPTNGLRTDHNLYVTNGLDPSGAGVVEDNVIFGAPNGFNIKLGGGAPDDSGAAHVVVRNNTMYDAQQNVTIAWRSHHITVERNLMGRGEPGEPGYTNVRGFENTGTDNVARFNVGFESSGVVGNYNSPSGVQDADGNRYGLEPRFPDPSSCRGYDPQTPEAGAYGAGTIFSRVAGTTRIETAERLSRAAYDRDATRSVLLASSRDYPDALAGAALAGRLGAPILLTSPDMLDRLTENEIRRLEPNTVVLLGGESALSRNVARRLTEIGVPEVRRLGGADRFATARLIAEEVGGSVVYVVEGANQDPARGWPDAVAVSWLSAATERPILLVRHDQVPDATAAALTSMSVEEVTIVGGESAVSEKVEAELADADGDGVQNADVSRTAGADRYETSARLASAGPEARGEARRLWFATGRNWPDALSAGPAVAVDGGTMLLVDGDALDRSPSTREWLESLGAEPVSVRLIGGIAAISDEVQDGVARAVLAD